MASLSRSSELANYMQRAQYQHQTEYRSVEPKAWSGVSFFAVNGSELVAETRLSDLFLQEPIEASIVKWNLVCKVETWRLLDEVLHVAFWVFCEILGYINPARSLPEIRSVWHVPKVDATA